ncbi:ArsR/SmtB family transcription factor [Caldinitratiruptor microaerophilus]|uniref:Transcriptional regulator n=1 Tax=Caldinitratiruptor microaerophilus TaxID=671077 RepID=A0AA35G8M9_9FIRM|nr:metalloregulator ArsR/SmtB family transcription factor [Caldinitratiruptor microaerophilus]BDG61190.1 transcriptional regulator [Caldinitratiruptor microaerophilus]
MSTLEEGRTRDVCGDPEPRGDRVQQLRERILEVAGLSELFRVLADETRAKILYLLAQEELCVHTLAEILDLTLPAISHHLRLLKIMRLVRYRRDGKHVYYTLADEHVLRLIQVAQDHYEEER